MPPYSQMNLMMKPGGMNTNLPSLPYQNTNYNNFFMKSLTNIAQSEKLNIPMATGKGPMSWFDSADRLAQNVNLDGRGPLVNLDGFRKPDKEPSSLLSLHTAIT